MRYALRFLCRAAQAHPIWTILSATARGHRNKRHDVSIDGKHEVQPLVLHSRSRRSICRILTSFLIVCGLLYVMERSRKSLQDGNDIVRRQNAEISPIANLRGATKCDISVADMYPTGRDARPLCDIRQNFLTAVSQGSRRGTDQPYIPFGCTYRWFPPQEIHAIMSRFSFIAFVGDSLAQRVYMGLLVLLQDDVEYGAISLRNIDEDHMSKCSCGKPFAPKSSCNNLSAKTYKDLPNHSEGYGRRTPHAYIPYSHLDTVGYSSSVRELLADNPRTWQPSPIIFSLTGDLSINSTTAALNTIAGLTAEKKRNMPILILGPEHADKGQRSKALDYDSAIQKHARHLDTDFLGLWNMTAGSVLSANGKEAQKNAIVQAMMVVNWLARTKTS